MSNGSPSLATVGNEAPRAAPETEHLRHAIQPVPRVDDLDEARR
jgi:hypothetical protein